MADEPTNLNATWKSIIAMLVLGFNGGLIVYLVMYGQSNNSLHTSALAWSFGSSIALLAGLGFGEMSGLLSKLITPKP